MIEIPKLFEWHKGRLFITYRWRYDEWNNPYFDNKPWHCWSWWQIVIGHEPDSGWFHKEDLYYDGMTYKSITLFGLTIGHHYCYDSKEKK